MTRRCVDCDTPLVPKGHHVPDGHAIHAAGTAPLAGTVVERSKSVCCGCADRLDNGRTERANDLPNAVARPPVIPDLPHPDLDDAPCARVRAAFPDVDPWFSDVPHIQKQAIAVCHECPVRAACLTLAMAAEASHAAAGRYGIWGGLTPEQRYAAHRRARRAS